MLVVNIAVSGRLFRVEYSAYQESNEGTFIAIARQVAAHPGDLLWWPEWEAGLPFQNTYLPLLPLTVGFLSRLSGHSAALSFHQFSAAMFCLGPGFFFLMCWRITRRPEASLIASLAYSLVSTSALVFDPIRTDVGGAWNLRRLQILGYYGEAPHTASMAMLPLAILFLYKTFALKEESKRRFAIFFACGVLTMAATLLFNAFGGVLLMLAGFSLLVAVDGQRFRRVFLGLIAIGVAAYAVASPLLPPSTLAAIRMNSPTVDGDYRFTGRSLAGVAVLGLGVALLWWTTRLMKLPALRLFVAFTFLTGGIIGLGFWARSYVVPQPHRYQIAFDMAAAFVVVFGAAELLRRKARPLLIPAGIVAIALLGVQLRHVLRYSHGLIHSVDMTQTQSYRVARWVDEHMNGQRVMLPASYSYQFNDFSDGPQLFGGHSPMLPNYETRVAAYTILSGQNAGARDAEISILWLKAMGARAILVPGSQSEDVYKPFVNPQKFEGVLPVLWRQSGDTIYAVPSRNESLAHVVPASSLVRDMPVHGLDVGEIEAYVHELEDPAMPDAALVWPNRHTVEIQAEIRHGQALSVQETYTPGWRASVNGREQPVLRDGLGLMALEPGCDGPCYVTLTYDGGAERRLTSGLSLLALLSLAAYLAIRIRVRPAPQS